MSQMLNDAKQAAECVRTLLSRDADTYAGLGRRLRELNPPCVTTIARGSSDHAATYANYLIPLCTGKVVASLAPSIVTVLRARLDMSKHFVLAVSQSGRSPDIIAALETAKQGGALTAALVNDVTSPVAHKADVLLAQNGGSEGIAATKTVLCTMAAMVRLVAAWSQDAKLDAALRSLPAVLEKAFERGSQLDTAALKGVSHVYVLSRGLGLSIAYETALKLKETCGVHAEAYSAAEVRHGPREIVGGNFLVLALPVPGSGEEDIIAAANELRAQGARLLVIGKEQVPMPEDPRLYPLAALQFIYPWLARASVALGHDPDRPRTLKSKVIQTT